LITFILLAVPNSHHASATTGVDLRHARGYAGLELGGVLPQCAIAKAKYANADEMDFEAPLTSLVWITSITSIILTYIVSYLMIPVSR